MRYVCDVPTVKRISDGIQLSEAITGDGAAIFRHACGMDLEGIVSKRIGIAVRERPDAGMAEDEESGFQRSRLNRDHWRDKT